MKVKINKKLFSSNEEVDKLIKERGNEPYVAVSFDNENLPNIETNQQVLPIEVANEMLRMIFSEYQKQKFDSLFKDLPDKYREYTSHLYRQLQTQKKWSFFWYACFMIALLIILLGGKF